MIVDGDSLAMTRGDTESLVATMVDRETGAPVEFDEGDSAVMTVRKKRKDESPVIFAIVASEYDGNMATFPIPHELTCDLEPGSYVYDVEVTFSDGTVKTIVGGGESAAVLRIYPDVTHE